MKDSRYRLVAFDFDGTLADSFPWFSAIINDVADRYRFRRIAGHEIHELRGMDARGIIRHLGIPAWKLPFITRHMHRLAAREIAGDPSAIPLFPGIPEMLSALGAAGLCLGIASSNSESNIRRAMGPVEAGRFGHYACGASLFGKAKRLRGLIREAGLTPSEVLYIGDEIRDHAAATEAGCDFGAVGWGYTRADALGAGRPAHLFRTPDEIADCLVSRVDAATGGEIPERGLHGGLPDHPERRHANL